jgi:lipopolysaccharide/colanic/teichoic acid biosynthesis glycosyltransferase
MDKNCNYIYDGMTAFEKEVKRWFDFLTALVCIIIFSPLYLICYIAIKRDNDGPVIYKQIRIGRFGRPFYIYKFRSMVVDAEKNGEPQLWDAKSDNRLTKTGKFLRDHHLDELPQLWNVLIGNMSLVGPRPERPYFIEKIEQQAPYYCLLYKIRPGLTSWGPIKVGYTDTMEKMLQRLHYDLTYMENMSLLLDLKILFFTIKVIADGKGK